MDLGWKILGFEYWLKIKYEFKFYILFIKYVVFEFKYILNYEIKYIDKLIDLFIVWGFYSC